MADWVKMSQKNKYTPTIHSINLSQYKEEHPFEMGTSFILSQLIVQNIPNKSELLKSFNNIIRKTYTYDIINKDFSIDINIDNTSTSLDKSNCKLPFDKAIEVKTSTILIYDNKNHTNQFIYMKFDNDKY